MSEIIVVKASDLDALYPPDAAPNTNLDNSSANSKAPPPPPSGQSQIVAPNADDDNAMQADSGAEMDDLVLPDALLKDIVDAVDTNKIISTTNVDIEKKED